MPKAKVTTTMRKTIVLFFVLTVLSSLTVGCGAASLRTAAAVEPDARETMADVCQDASLRQSLSVVRTERGHFYCNGF